MFELLGRPPKSFTSTGEFAAKFFNRKGELRRIRSLKFWDLKGVLEEKYRLGEERAVMLTSFLLPMLSYEIEKRATAEQCLQHPFISGIRDA